MDDKIKWALLAVGAYFLYDWWSTQTATSTTGATGGDAATKAAADAAAAAAASTAARTAADAAAASQAAGQAVSVNLFRNWDDDSLAKQAAKTGQVDAVAAADARGLRYNHHQWNWFREQATGVVQPDPVLWAADKANEVVTVSQYLALRTAAGMAGLGGGLGWAPRLPWSTAWQA